MPRSAPRTRDISSEERGLVARLLDLFEADLATRPTSDETSRGRLLAELSGYRTQLATARVQAWCECGCPSFAFVCDHDDQAADVERVLADAPATSPEGHAIEILLFVRGGRLRTVELYATESVGRFTLPQLSDVVPWSRFTP